MKLKKSDFLFVSFSIITFFCLISIHSSFATVDKEQSSEATIEEAASDPQMIGICQNNAVEAYALKIEELSSSRKDLKDWVIKLKCAQLAIKRMLCGLTADEEKFFDAFCLTPQS
jgi:hypothetical protein